MAQPITAPIETDVQEIAEIGLEYLESVYPDWDRQRADPAFQQVMTTARLIAEARDTASDVPPAITRYQGRWLVGLPSVEASAAQATATATMVDDAGYTIPAGTPFEILTSGDTSQVFRTTATVVVPLGQTSTAVGELDLVAEEPGAASSGLADTLTIRPLDTLSFVLSTVLEGPTAGGADAETDDEYIARLIEEFELFTPRPILPRDFAVLARRVPGVHRALDLNLYDPADVVTQQTTLAVTGGTPSSGSFGINVSVPFVETYSTLIPYNATATQVRDALLGMSNLHTGDVTTTGGPLPGTPVVVTWAGALAGQVVTAATAANTLNNGASPALSITRTAVSGYGNERTITLALTDESGDPVGSPVRTEVEDLLEEMREVNFVVKTIDATYTPISVEWEGVADPGFDPQAAEDAGNAALALYLDPGTYGTPPGDVEAGAWRDEPIIRYGELYALLNSVEGIRYISSLKLGRVGDTLREQNVTLVGPAALPTAGTITGNVVA
jgi:hypothetical protein